MCKRAFKDHEFREMRTISQCLTSDPAGMSWTATACTRGSGGFVDLELTARKVVCPEHITTTLKSQLWLNKAARGETATPIGLASCDVMLKTLDVN